MKILLSLALGPALAGRGDPVPLGRPAPVPVEQLRVDNPAVVPMTGEWKFRIALGEDDAAGLQNGPVGPV